MGEGCMGRLAGYEGALDRLAVEGEAAALRAALRRNVFGTLPEAEGDLAGLVAYVLAQAAPLDAQPGETLPLGRVAFSPAPGGADDGPPSAPRDPHHGASIGNDHALLCSAFCPPEQRFCRLWCQTQSPQTVNHT